MQRRRFLGTLCALGAGPPALASSSSIGEDWHQRRLHARIAGLSRYPESASQITKIHRARLPHPSSVGIMLDELKTILRCSSSHLLRMSDNELLATVSNRVMRDFDEARTIDLDGWLMSETEILICALIASPQQDIDDRTASHRTMADRAA